MSEDFEVKMHVRGSTQSALGNSLLVRFTIAHLLTTIAEWSLFVGALVYAFDHGGSRAAGFSSVALLIPTAIAAPAAGAAAHRRRPSRVRLGAYAVETLSLIAAAVAAFAEAPVVVVVGCCVVTAGAYTFVAPACAVLLPAMVRSARELTVANLWMGSCEGISLLCGSALAAVLLAVEGPALALAGCAALALVGTLMTAGLGRGEPPPVRYPDEGERVGATRLVIHSIKRLRERPGATGVLAVAGGQYLLIGALDLIVVVLANEALGLGDSGPGLLGTAVGVGALLSAVASAVLVKRQRLAPLLAGAIAGIATMSFALALTPTLATALVLFSVVGFSRSLLDLTSRMLLQRATPVDSLAAIFGAIELFAGVGMVLGSLMTQVLIAASGVDAALIGLGIFFTLLLLLTWRSLRVADDSADIPIVAISLLRRIPAFAPLPPLALEAVARTATEVSVAEGETVVTEGEAGEAFYAVVDGSFDVTISGRWVRTATRGASFGEVALLADVPRTATVSATCPGSLLAIQRVPFLIAVTGSDSSRQAAWGVIRTMELSADIRDRDLAGELG
jgi:MFS family permease